MSQSSPAGLSLPAAERAFHLLLAVTFEPFVMNFPDQRLPAIGVPAGGRVQRRGGIICLAVAAEECQPSSPLSSLAALWRCLWP